MIENRHLFFRQITWFCLLAFIPYLSLWMWEGEFWLILFGLIGALPLLLNIYFLKKEKLAQAALNISIFGLINIYLYDDGISGDNGFYFFFFSVIIGIFVLFDAGEKKYKLIAFITTILTVILTNVNGLSPQLYKTFPELSHNINNLKEVNFFMAILVTSAQIYFMNKRVERVEEHLVNSLERAEQLSDLKSQFLSNMSHELRTPMNAILGITNVLIKDNPNEIQLKNLQLLKFSSCHLLHIINDILDYSRIEAGKLEIENARFNLHELIKNLSDSLIPLADEKGLKLLLDFDEHCSIDLSGDYNRLTQVLNNLVNNAIKFTNKGWVRLQVIQLESESQKAVVKFIVTDTGIGIEPEKHSLIFERFSQASSETTRKYGGTGLGLAICNKIIHLQNSKIELKSELEKGSEFSFILEFEKALPNDLEPLKEEAASLSMYGKKILLVEDNPINQFVAKSFLQDWGVNLIIVNNGKEAVDYVNKNQVDLILMDLQMPEMDGYEASRQIRQINNGVFSSLPIIALTASSKYEVGEQYRNAGMNDFINKPFKPEELFMKMTSFLFH